MTAFWLSSAVENTWTLLGRDRRVAVDEPREHAAQGFDAERKRRHVEQEHVLDVALKNARLHGGADRNDFIGVHALVRLLAEQVFDDFLHLRHARHAADENDFVDLGRRHARVFHRALARLDRLLDELVDERFEFRARQFQRHVLRAVLVGRDERKIDFGLRRRRKLDLGFFRGFLQALERELVLPQIDALLFLEFVGEVRDETHVEVFAAEERIAVRRLHFEDAVADFQNRDVEGAAAEIVDGDRCPVFVCRGRKRALPPSAR